MSKLNVDNKEVAELFEAIRSGNLAMVEKYLSVGIDINSKMTFKIESFVDNNIRYSPLSAAIALNRPEIVDFLLAKGADVNSISTDSLDKSPLCIAAISDLTKPTKFFELIAEKVDANKQNTELGNNALHEISNIRLTDFQSLNLSQAKIQLHKMAELLIAKGVDIDSINLKGETPLLLAIDQNNSSLAQDFVDKGANVDIADKKGNTPLHYAARNTSFDLTKKLINKGANVNVANHDSETPLSLAIALYSFKHTRHLAQYLVDKGAYVNVLGNDNRTLLEKMASKSKSDTLEFLVKNGATLSENYNPRITHQKLKLGVESIQFFKTKYLALRAEYLDQVEKSSEVPRQEFSKELGGLFNEHNLTKGPLFKLHHNKQPLISYKDLLESTKEEAQTAVDASPASSMISSSVAATPQGSASFEATSATPAFSSSPSASSTPTIAENLTNSDNITSRVIEHQSGINSSETIKVGVSKNVGKVSITGMGEYIEKSPDARASAYSEAGESILDQARLIGEDARAAAAILHNDNDSPRLSRALQSARPVRKSTSSKDESRQGRQ